MGGAQQNQSNLAMQPQQTAAEKYALPIAAGAFVCLAFQALSERRFQAAYFLIPSFVRFNFLYFLSIIRRICVDI